jgi:predicted cobalt transporter CbtA
MQTITRAAVITGLFACVVMSAVQAMASKPKGGTCEIFNGACVSMNCTGECAPIFPDPCACIH